MSCRHPVVIAHLPSGTKAADAERIGEKLQAALKLERWDASVLIGDDQRLEFVECSWCRKPRRRWFSRG